MPETAGFASESRLSCLPAEVQLIGCSHLNGFLSCAPQSMAEGFFEVKIAC